MEKVYKVDSLFSSIQGEGTYLGTPAVFLRFHGCNLECPWCDTKTNACFDWTKEELLNAVVQKLFDNETSHLILTGGEPLTQLDSYLFHDLLLLSSVTKLQIETNGTLPFPKTLDTDEVCSRWKKLWVSCSPKLLTDPNTNIIESIHFSILPIVNEYKIVIPAHLDVDMMCSMISRFVESTRNITWIQPCTYNPSDFYEDPIEANMLTQESLHKAIQIIGKLDSDFNVRLGIQAHRVWNIP